MLDSITDSMDMGLSKLQETVRDREAWHAADHGLPRARHDLVTEQQQPAKQEMQVQSLGQEDPLEKEMATPLSTLVWEIPGTEESGGRQSMGLHKFRHHLMIKQQQHCLEMY